MTVGKIREVNSHTKTFMTKNSIIGYIIILFIKFSI